MQQGKNRAFRLGKWLRKRYDGLIPTHYNASDIYIRSTDEDRCLQTAQCVLAGLYPPKGHQEWNPSVPNWQPIPVHTAPESIDPFASLNCPIVSATIPALFPTEPFRSVWTEHLPAIKIASEGSGQDLNNIAEVAQLFDTLRSESKLNLTLPSWADEVYDPLYNVTAYAFASTSWTEEQKRISAGPMLNEVLKQFNQSLSKSVKNKREVLMMSAHDSNIVSILMALDLYDYVLPPYSACLIFELKSRDGTNYVDIVYKRKDNVESLVPRSCGEKCTLKGFSNAISKFVIDQTQWEELCRT